jgi:hypothetical protein
MLIRVQDYFGRAAYIEQNAIVAILPHGDQKAGGSVTHLVVGVNTEIKMRGTPDDIIVAINSAVTAMMCDPPSPSAAAMQPPAAGVPPPARGRRGPPGA